MYSKIFLFLLLSFYRRLWINNPIFPPIKNNFILTFLISQIEKTKLELHIFIFNNIKHKKNKQYLKKFLSDMLFINCKKFKNRNVYKHIFMIKKRRYILLPLLIFKFWYFFSTLACNENHNIRTNFSSKNNTIVYVKTFLNMYFSNLNNL